MNRAEQRSRASSLILELAAAQEPERQDSNRNTHRLSLDSKLTQVSRQELLSIVDDKLLIQEVKARLISSEIEDKRKWLKRRDSVKDLVKAFDKVQIDAECLNSGGRSSVRFLLGQFGLSELCDELLKRLEADNSSCQLETRDSQDRRLSAGLRRILFQKGSRSRSSDSFGSLPEKPLFIIPEIALPECEEGNDNSFDSTSTCKDRSEPWSESHNLQLPRVEDKPSFEPDLQKTLSNTLESPEEDDDEKLMNVLDDIFTLKQRLWNTAKDMEKLSEKTTKTRGELATLRQMRTAYANN